MNLAEMSAHSFRTTGAGKHRPGAGLGVEACFADDVPA
jgi:hypothetical protein